MIKFKRPSGSEIEVADTEANRKIAKELGWVEVKETTKPKRKPRAAKNGRDS